MNDPCNNLNRKIEQLQQELAEREFEIKLFKETSDAVNQQFKLDKLLDFIALRAQELVDAETLLIPILDESCSEYTYMAGYGKGADEIVGESLPLNFGICGWVWKHKRPWWRGVLDELSDEEKNRWEKEAGSVIVVPLIGKRHFLGGIAGINKNGLDDFRRRDLQILMMFASQVATAIENALYFEEMKAAKEEAENLQKELQKFNADLEQIIEDRTYSLKITNHALEDSLKTLKDTQSQLIQAEKMASLGGLVAGIAHEINTPIGISVTSTSHLEECLNNIRMKLSDNNMKKSDLDYFIKQSEQGLGLLAQNLQTASELIRSFKLVAADQSADESREINVRKYIEKILLSLKPQLSHTGIDVSLDANSNISVVTWPGSLAQVFTNLIMNSVEHAFHDFDTDNKSITIQIKRSSSELKIEYSDNGKGMDSEQLSKLFDPFYTTRRSEGSHGLGMSVSYNIIKSAGGSISARSQPGHGLTIDIVWPVAPA